MELVIKEITDLKKLEGWRIVRQPEVITGQNTILSLELSHPAAANHIKLHIIADVSLGRSGNVMICNPTITLRTEDIYKSETAGV